MDERTVDLMTKSAPLHDIGKVGVADRILLKPDKLTDEEFAEMKKHPKLGRDALLRAEQMLGSTSSFLQLARDIAYTHHEKWDGTGYPDGTKGGDIPLGGRIMAIADVYDALISKRCYKPAFPHEKAVEIIKDGSGKHFDPAMVDAFLACADEFQAIAAQFKDDHGH
jgi:response regulator RpfG family c-di-GMP phosphodiesterase